MISAAPSPIDMEHLGTYTQGDRDLELELLTMFLPSAEGYLDAMKLGSGEAWWTAAHSLKGVALGVGAGEVATLAEAPEELQDAPPGPRANQIAALGAALERVRDFVAALG